MKTTITSLIIAVIFTSCSATKTQKGSIPKKTFETQLSETLTKINNAKDIKSYFGIINELKRIGALYPNEWLPDYYVALLDIKLSMAIQDKTKKQALLKEALKTITSLKENKKTFESEVLTLEGYYYYAKIAGNPQKNGPLYYKNVIQSYQKAIALDKNNPRPVLMLSIFQKMMSKATGREYTGFCNKLSQIEQMFNRSKPAKEIYPKWGMKLLKKQQKESCNQQ